jgi:hypothetical protein
VVHGGRNRGVSDHRRSLGHLNSRLRLQREKQHGLCTELLDLLTRQRFHAALAGIAFPNAKSVAFYEATRFVHKGTYVEVGFKRGAWRDIGWWRRALEDSMPPAEPRPFHSLVTKRDG